MENGLYNFDDKKNEMDRSHRGPKINDKSRMRPSLIVNILKYGNNLLFLSYTMARMGSGVNCVSKSQV